ncbi:hypothetical protein DPEC_G00068150 [Dallia pectoralis]|uniref:Uncharacterized protein n=1 Tax=Dallia pectoralis TaxID=75939 RepID=A0ACC2H2S0_DALPE|nr:hypothetical protein DPEC_G00068150 [Dallia pectoralis]
MSVVTMDPSSCILKPLETITRLVRGSAGATELQTSEAQQGTYDNQQRSADQRIQPSVPAYVQGDHNAIRKPAEVTVPSVATDLIRRELDRVSTSWELTRTLEVLRYCAAQPTLTDRVAQKTKTSSRAEKLDSILVMAELMCEKLQWHDMVPHHSEDTKITPEFSVYTMANENGRIGDSSIDTRVNYIRVGGGTTDKIPIVHVDRVQMEHGHTRDTPTEHKAFCNSEGFKWEYFTVGCFAPA